MARVKINGVEQELTLKLTFWICWKMWELIAKGKSKSRALKKLGIGVLWADCPCCEYSSYTCDVCPLLPLWQQGTYISYFGSVEPKTACINYSESPFLLWIHSRKDKKYALQIADYAKQKYEGLEAQGC